MNTERNNASPPANIGISLLLVVFLILCLFTFSAIALVQAENEWHQAGLTKSSRDAYYAAANQAETDLAELNRKVAASSGNNAAGTEPDAADTADNATPDTPEAKISRQYELSDIQALSVVFKYDKETNAYRFSEFKTIATKNWEGDDTVNVIR